MTSILYDDICVLMEWTEEVDEFAINKGWIAGAFFLGLFVGGGIAAILVPIFLRDYEKKKVILTLFMLGNFFKYLFLSKFSKNSLFPPIFFFLIYNLNVKQFGSQMKPHILWGFIWIQIVCKGHQRS